MATPIRLCGLRIIEPSIRTRAQYCASQKITEPQIELIYKQSHSYTLEIRATQAKINNRAHNSLWQFESLTANELKAKLPSDLQRAVTASTEKDASRWLSTLQIKKHGFSLHKGAFRNAICLGMAGNHHTYHPCVFVTGSSQLIMPWAAHGKGSNQFVTIRFETWQRTSSVRYVTTWAQSPNYNLWLVSSWPIGLPIRRMVPDWIL